MTLAPTLRSVNDCCQMIATCNKQHSTTRRQETCSECIRGRASIDPIQSDEWTISTTFANLISSSTCFCMVNATPTEIVEWKRLQVSMKQQKMSLIKKGIKEEEEEQEEAWLGLLKARFIHMFLNSPRLRSGLVNFLWLMIRYICVLRKTAMSLHM
jgi:hypothetical protein